jgi:hypothetical protein
LVIVDEATLAGTVSVDELVGAAPVGPDDIFWCEQNRSIT